MIHSRKSALAVLVAAGVAFPSTAQAEFCGIAGESPQEIAANVLKTREFEENGGNERYVSYVDKTGLTTLTITTPANNAHPAVVCRNAFREKDGAWHVATDAICAATDAACKTMMSEFRELDTQMGQAIEKEQSKP